MYSTFHFLSSKVQLPEKNDDSVSETKIVFHKCRLYRQDFEKMNQTFSEFTLFTKIKENF
jgi:hypothetical protein